MNRCAFCETPVVESKELVVTEVLDYIRTVDLHFCDADCADKYYKEEGSNEEI